MPIYEYRCRKGHNFEAIQSMSEDPVSACEQCGAPVERVFHPIAVHFKGSGFYTTDYAKKGAKPGSDDGASEKSGADSKGDSSPGTDSKSKSDSESKSPKKSKSSSSAD